MKLTGTVVAGSKEMQVTLASTESTMLNNSGIKLLNSWKQITIKVSHDSDGNTHRIVIPVN